MFRRRVVREDDYSRLLAEVEYWRKAFESERSRADRLHDSVMASVGRPPISDEGLGEMKELQSKVQKAQEEFVEMLNDEDETPDTILGDLLEPAEEVLAAGVK